jgi:hypothetical protein
MMALIFLLGAMTLFNLFADYRKLEQSLNWQLQPEDNRPTWHKTLDTLSQLHGESLFGHYIDLVYAYQLPLDRDALREKILITERAIRFSPVDRSTYKLAYLLALDGQSAAARLALQRAQATHPQLQAESIRQLMELSKTYAELKPLLEQLEAAKPQR